MGDWGFPLMIVGALGFAVTNTGLAVRARTPQELRAVAVGLACEVVGVAALLASVLVR